jgi:hypothetical protein
MAKAKPPLKKYKVGRVNVSIWKNDGPNGPLYAVDLHRRYKDGDEWKTSHSFLIEHLDDLIAAATLAQSYAPLLKGIDQKNGDDAGEGVGAEQAVGSEEE